MGIRNLHADDTCDNCGQIIKASDQFVLVGATVKSSGPITDGRLLHKGCHVDQGSDMDDLQPTHTR